MAARSARGDEVKTDGMTRVSRAALLVLIALIPLRAYLPEAASLQTPAFSRHLDGLSTPGPGTTLVITGVIFAALLAACVERWRRGLPLRRIGGVLGAGLFLIGGVIATVRCDAPRSALVGLFEMAGVVAYLIAMRQLLERPWQRRLVLGVVVATGAAVAVKCFIQVYHDYPQTLKYYEEQRDANQGELSPTERGQRYDFEQRLKSQSATGYYSHSNLVATLLATVIVAALVLVTSRGASAGVHPATRVAPAVAGILALAALYLTQSKGALGAVLIGAAAWAVWRFTGAWWARRRRMALVLFWMAAIGGIAGGVAYGVAMDGLPTLSLKYRWMYWRGAAEMITAQGWDGVGPNQFGTWFPRYKPVECPEEVSAPHSWIVRAASEWGVLGLIGLLLFWIGVSIRATRSVPQVDSSEELKSAAGPPLVVWLVRIVLTWLAGVLLCHHGDLGSGERVTYLFGSMGEFLSAWCLAFAVIVAESGDRPVISNRPVALRVGVLIAVLVFFVHSTVDLAMFSGGPMTLLMALLAIALAESDVSESIAAVPGNVPAVPARGRVAIVVGVFGVSLLYYGAVVVLPTLVSGAILTNARRIDSGSDYKSFQQSGAWDNYRLAALTDPRDWVPLDEYIDESIGMRQPRLTTPEQCTELLKLVDELQRRTPHGDAPNEHRYRLHWLRYRLTGNIDDMMAAIDALRASVAYYPTSPVRQVTLGQHLVELAGRTEDHSVEESARLEAIAALKRAIELDRQRIYVSAANRMSAGEIDSARRLIRQLGGQPD